MGDKSAFVGIVTKLFDITGKALSGEWGTDDPDGCGIPVLRTTNFTNVGKVNYDNVVTRNIQKKNISDKLLKKGDIIIEKSGGTDKNPVGRVIYFEGEENKYLFNNFTGLLRVKDKNEWYPKYVFYSMFAYYKRGGTRRFENKTTGLHNLKLDDYIKRLDIQKASYVDQVHVFKLLDCVRLQIDNMERELELLDKLVKARFVEMFGDPEDNPFKWDKMPLSNIMLNANNGMARRGNDENGNIVLRLVELQDGYINYSNPNRICLNENEKKRYLLKNNDFLFARVNGNPDNVGRCAVFHDIGEDVYHNDHIIRVHFNEELLNGVFASELINSNFGKRQLKKRIKTSAGQYTVSQDGIGAIVSIVPPLELQNQFASFVKEIDKSRSRIQKSLEASQELFDSLMKEYFC